MSLPIPPDLWQRVCLFLTTHPTCQVVIHQHEGHVIYVDLGVVKERIKAGCVRSTPPELLAMATGLDHTP